MTQPSRHLKGCVIHTVVTGPAPIQATRCNFESKKMHVGAA